MASPLLRKNTIIAAKIETTEGTMVTPGATDVRFVVHEAKYKTEIAKIDRNIVGPGFAGKQALISNKLARATFRTEIVGSGTAGTEPAWGNVLLKACGFKLTTVASTSNQYDPVTNPSTYDSTGANGNCSLTIWVYEDGVVKKARGCRGTVKITAEAGQTAFMDWEFLGIHDSVADAAYPTLHATADTQVPPILENATLAFHALGTDTILVKSISLDIGNSIAPRWDANYGSGIKSIFIGDRKVTATIDPEQTLQATFDPILREATPTLGAFTFTLGSAVGNRFILTAPAAKVQITDTDEADRDGILTNTLQLAFFVPLIEDATDKEIRFLLN